MSGSSRNTQVGRPRSILYLQTTSEIGGSDVALVDLVEQLDRRRFTPIVALPADGPLVARLRDAGSEVLIVDRMKKLTTRRGWRYAARFLLNYPRAVGSLARIASRERVDLIHTNTIHNPYGIGAAIVARKPHVWHVREIVWQSGVVRRVERLLTRLSDRVIVTSEAVGEMFRTRAGEIAANVRKVPDGVNLQAFAPGASGDRVRAALGFPQGAPIAGVACRLDPWKGVDVFLRAAASVRAAVPAARFVVVGGPIEGQETHAHELEALATALGLDDVLRFTGWRYRPADMPSVYAALDLLVLPSRRPEPFGLVLLEAMAAGLPVVATDHGGPREICVDGETGLLVPPGDPDRLAGAMRMLLQNPDRARVMGQAGRRRVEQLYDLRGTVRAIEAVYDDLLPPRAARGL